MLIYRIITTLLLLLLYLHIPILIMDPDSPIWEPLDPQNTTDLEPFPDLPRWIANIESTTLDVEPPPPESRNKLRILDDTPFMLTFGNEPNRPTFSYAIPSASFVVLIISHRAAILVPATAAARNAYKITITENLKRHLGEVWYFFEQKQARFFPDEERLMIFVISRYKEPRNRDFLGDIRTFFSSKNIRGRPIHWLEIPDEEATSSDPMIVVDGLVDRTGGVAVFMDEVQFPLSVYFHPEGELEPLKDDEPFFMRIPTLSRPVVSPAEAFISGLRPEIPPPQPSFAASRPVFPGPPPAFGLGPLTPGAAQRPRDTLPAPRRPASSVIRADPSTASRRFLKIPSKCRMA
ncbi:hypothetical protein BJX99DRAFT_66475 [Aspergillus californicus]